MINLLKNPQNRNKKLAVLIDGEHYPDINRDSINLIRKYFKGNISGIIFLGGTEKLNINNLDKFYGMKVIAIKKLDRDFPNALIEFIPDLVYDLSDEPVVNHEVRLKIASYCFVSRCSYMGPDFYFEYEHKSLKPLKKSISIIGTGKRIGKTAVSAYIAKLLSKKNKVCIIAMGRGGPKKPQVIKGHDVEITPEFLLDISRKGMHASSDYIEDALFSRVDTVGCRRCGGGFGGRFFMSNINKGLETAEKLNPEILVIEGSGASVPPVETDFRICVVGADQTWESIIGYLGIYRIIISDVVFLTMCEEPTAKREDIEMLIRKINEIKPSAKIVLSVFRPEPLYNNISGKKVFVILTAKSSVENNIRNFLEEKYKCKVVKFSFNLSNRTILKRELNEYGDFDVLLTELKAASVDMVTEFAYKNKKEINYLNNVPVIIKGEENLKNLIKKLEN